MYRKYRQGWMKHLDFMIIDMLCLQVAFILSYIIRHGFQNPYLDMDYRNLAIFIEVADIAIIYIWDFSRRSKTWLLSGICSNTKTFNINNASCSVVYF